MDKLYAFEVKRASEEDIPAIIKITKDAFLKYCEMAGLSYDIEALNETYDDVKHDIETKEVYVVFIDYRLSPIQLLIMTRLYQCPG